MAMDFKNLPFWGQVALVAMLCVTMVCVAFWAFPNFSQMQQQNLADAKRLEDLQTDIRRGAAIEAKLPEFEKEIANLQKKLEDLLQILPTEPETGELLKWVKNLTDQSNLDLQRFDPGALKPVEFYREFPINMDVVGDYHDLGVFFDRISKYSRIINVDNVQISSNSSGKGSIHSTFTATTFVYDDKAASNQGSPR
jgi:type IV pilus assembly protein PilO